MHREIKPEHFLEGKHDGAKISHEVIDEVDPEKLRGTDFVIQVIYEFLSEFEIITPSCESGKEMMRLGKTAIMIETEPYLESTLKHNKCSMTVARFASRVVPLKDVIEFARKHICK